MCDKREVQPENRFQCVVHWSRQPPIGSLLVQMWMSFDVAALPKWPVLILDMRSLGPVPDHPERPCKPCGTKKIVLPTTAAVRPGANAEEYHPSDQITHPIPGRETEKSRAIDSIMTHARVFPLENKHRPKQARACRDASGPPVNLLAAISVPCRRQPADPANTAGCQRCKEPRALLDVIVLKFSQHGGAP